MGGAATPGLGMIEESSSPGDTPTGGVVDNAHGVERPGIVTTDSAMPLLSKRRRSSSSKSHLPLMTTALISVGNEGAMSTSFPPVDSSPETETPSEDVFVTVPAGGDPFRSESVGRRSSEVSGLVDSAPPAVPPTRPEISRVGEDANAKSKPLPAGGVPPLCTLVVDDDK